jgi:hypothetical protein
VSPAQAITTSGSPASLLAHSQIPTPRVQCKIASSMDSQLGVSFFAATMTLT